jgi:hypothetical protein
VGAVDGAAASGDAPDKEMRLGGMRADWLAGAGAAAVEPAAATGAIGVCILNISTERTQGHFLSPWSRGEEWSLLHKRTTIFSLCVSVRFEKACWWW